jgi:hypothetical protein
VAAVVEVKIAVKPLGVSVPPAGTALQATTLEQAPVELTTAVNVDVWPVATDPGFALTLIAVIVQALPLPPALPPHPAAMAARAMHHGHSRMGPPTLGYTEDCILQ